MAAPYHIKLKRTTKDLSEIQDYGNTAGDLRWGEPVVTNDGYMVIGDKKNNTQNPDGSYNSNKVSELKIFKAVRQVLKDVFVFYRTNTGNIDPPPVYTGTHITLINQNQNVLLPDTRATYVAYSQNYDQWGTPDYSDPSGVTTLQAAVHNNENAITDLTTPQYSSASTYEVGDQVIYNGNLYTCNTRITTPEAWNSSHWTLVRATTVAPAITAVYSIGPSAPSDSNLLWIDTTAITGGLKYYNGSAWVAVPVKFS